MIKLLTYPAMASPQSVALISEYLGKYVSKDAAVIDPYCGTGRLLIAPRKMGLSVFGVDRSPLAILASRVTHQRICISQLCRDLAKVSSLVEGPVGRIEVSTTDLFWFPEKGYRTLRHILRVCDSTATSNPIRRVFWLALCNAARQVSYVRESEYKLHRLSISQRNQHLVDARSVFLENCRSLVGILSQLRNLKGSYRLMEGDIASIKLKKRSFDAIVSSPPYGDSASTVGYGQFTKIPLMILMNSVMFKSEFNKMHMHRCLDSYFLGGTRCNNPRSFDLPSYVEGISNRAMVRFCQQYFFRLARMEQLLAPSGICTFILGNRTCDGKLFPLIEHTIRFMLSKGLRLIARHNRILGRKALPRTMKHRRGGVLSTHNGMNYESVLLLSR